MGKDAEVPLVSDPAKDPKRMATFTRKVAMIINSLIRGGYIVRKDVVGIKASSFTIPGATGGSVTSVGATSSSADLTIAGSPITSSGSFTFTVVSAPKWTTGRTVSITGDLAYTSGSLDGTGNVTGAGTLATVNSNVGSFTNANITVDAKGRITAAANGSAGSGTVTSVAQTVPVEFSIAGSPVTTSGTLAITKATQTANTVWAGPATGSAAQPIFRALVTADLPAGAGSPLTTKGDIYVFSTTNDRLPVGSNGQVLSADSTQTTGLKWIPAASGSSPLTTKGDLFTHSSVDARLPVGTDTYILSADSGQTTGLNWIPASGSGVGAINAWEHPFTKPTIAGVTQVNTTGFTSSDDTNGLFIYRSGALSATDNITLAHLAVPVGNWDLIIRIQSMCQNSGFSMAGAHLYESGTGKIITWSYQGTSATPRLCINYFSSTTAFSSQPKTVTLMDRPTWLKIHYDGTNFTFFWGFDGYSWVQFGTTFSKTALFTTGATHAGFFLDPNDANNITGVKCMSLTCA